MTIAGMTRAGLARRTVLWPVLAVTVMSCADDCPEGNLVLSDEAITFEAEQGGSDPAPRVVAVTSDGRAIVDLTAIPSYGTTQPHGWLTASLSQPSTPSELRLTARTGTLAAGTYTAVVLVAAPNAANSARNVFVTFRVAGLFGYPTEFATAGDVNANTLIGQAIAVPGQSFLLGSVNLFVKSPLPAGAQVKVGIYADAGGQPGALVAATPATPVVVGRNQIPVNVTLSGGTYWFMMVFDNNVSVGAGPTTTSAKWVSHPFANALPATFPAHSTGTTPVLNLFLKVFETQPYQ